MILNAINQNTYFCLRKQLTVTIFDLLYTEVYNICGLHHTDIFYVKKLNEKKRKQLKVTKTDHRLKSKTRKKHSKCKQKSYVNTLIKVVEQVKQT